MISVPLVADGVVGIPECVLVWLALSSAATLLLSPVAWLEPGGRLVISALKVGALFVPFHRRQCDSAESIVLWHMDHKATSGRNMPVGWYVGINDGNKQTLYVHGPDNKRGAEEFRNELLEVLDL